MPALTQSEGCKSGLGSFGAASFLERDDAAFFAVAGCAFAFFSGALFFIAYDRFR
ncbi:MAG: hypothetical protein V4646_15525 [Pseudomonadota bacterium]